MDDLKEKADALKNLLTKPDGQVESFQSRVNAQIADMIYDSISIIDKENQAGGGSLFCPSCGSAIEIKNELFENEESLVCPKCHEPLNILTQEF